MKFRILATVLTLLVIGLFITAISLSNSLKNSKRELELSYADLKMKDSLLQNSKDSLVSVMKKLNVWEAADQQARENQVKRRGFNIGITAQANNKNFHDLIAYTIGSGFQLAYANQERGGINGPPRIFYYSEQGREIAESLKAELESEFSHLAQIDQIQEGSSAEDPNTITVFLRFTR